MVKLPSRLATVSAWPTDDMPINHVAVAARRRHLLAFAPKPAKRCRRCLPSNAGPADVAFKWYRTTGESVDMFMRVLDVAATFVRVAVQVVLDPVALLDATVLPHRHG